MVNMRLKNSGATMNGSSSSSVPLRVALVRQGVGHRICFLSANEKENYAVKKGLLLMQRDKLFSRWKERYFILTKDYLACFKKSSKIASSDMGGFIFKVNLADVDGVEWSEKKESGIIAISCPPEGRFFLRGKSGLDEWLQVLRETISQSKGRRQALRGSMTRDGVQSQICDGTQYLNRKLPLHYTYSDCGPELYRLGRNSSTDFIRGSTGLLRISEDYRSSASSSVADSSRFSLLTDIDLRCDADDTPTPSPSSSSCSTASRHYLAPPHPAFASGVPMGHRRTHSQGRQPPRLPDPIIVYTNPKSSPRVERSQSDAFQFEAHIRRCTQIDRDIKKPTATGQPQLCRRASSKPFGNNKPS